MIGKYFSARVWALFYKPVTMRLSLSMIICFLILCNFVNAQDTIVVITPHPDDAEASCGGLIANSVAKGDKVIILTMTGGELGIGGETNAAARLIREAEAKKAAALQGAAIEFFGAVDASLAVDSASTALLKSILLRLKPTMVLAPWPMDVHTDHQATGLLAWRVFQDQRFSFSLYFYETTNSPHSKSFAFVPTDYIEISAVMEKKKEAVYCHASQDPAEWFGMYITLATARGYEADVPFAEAYIKAANFSGMGGRNGNTGKTLGGKR